MTSEQEVAIRAVLSVAMCKDYIIGQPDENHDVQLWLRSSNGNPREEQDFIRRFRITSEGTVVRMAEAR